MNIEPIPADTTAEAARVHLEIIRRLSPDKRMELALRLSGTIRDVVADGVRNRHPEYDEEQVRLAVMRLMLGAELFQKVRPGVEIAL
jgi:hypothetical protein